MRQIFALIAFKTSLIYLQFLWMIYEEQRKNTKIKRNRRFTVNLSKLTN